MVDGAKLTGELLDARFRLEVPIGRGRFGEVFHGTDESRGATCVVRVLHLSTDGLDVESTRARLREDLRLWARIAARPPTPGSSRGGIARVFGFALPEARDEGAVSYVASEWLDGETLENELARRRAGGLTGRAASDVVDKLDVIVEALAAIHAAGGVHGALHPRAIRTAARGRANEAVLIDGGLEAALRSLGDHFDVQTDIYQAPEQLSPHLGEVSPRTDVYALALIILELLADHVPIDADSMETLRRIALDPLARPTPAVLGIDLGPVASDVLARATALEPMARFDDAGTFWGTFKAALQRDLSHPARIRRSSAPPPPTPSGELDAMPASRPISRSPILRAPTSHPPPSQSQGPASRPPTSVSPISQAAPPQSARPSQSPISAHGPISRPPISRPPVSRPPPTGLTGPLITEPMEAFRLSAAHDAADTLMTAPLSSSSSIDVLNAVEPPPRESVRDVAMDTPLALPPVFTGTPQSLAQAQITTGARDNRSLRVLEPERRSGSSVPMYIGMAIGMLVGVFLIGRILFVSPRSDTPVDAASSVSARDAAAPVASSPAPDPYAFERALAALDARLPNCKQAVGPSGVGSLRAVFDPSGAVTDVTMDPPFAGTSRGGCIAGLFRTAHGPTYKGPTHETAHRFYLPE